MEESSTRTRTMPSRRVGLRRQRGTRNVQNDKQNNNYGRKSSSSNGRDSRASSGQKQGRFHWRRHLDSSDIRHDLMLAAEVQDDVTNSDTEHSGSFDDDEDLRKDVEELEASLLVTRDSDDAQASLSATREVLAVVLNTAPRPFMLTIHQQMQLEEAMHQDYTESLLATAVLEADDILEQHLSAALYLRQQVDATMCEHQLGASTLQDVICEQLEQYLLPRLQLWGGSTNNVTSEHARRVIAWMDDFMRAMITTCPDVEWSADWWTMKARMVDCLS